MHRVVIGFLLALVVVGGLVLVTQTKMFSGTGRAKPGVVVEDFREIARLGLMELPVSGVETVGGSNWCGGVETIIAYRGTLQVGVELNAARIEPASGGYTLHLPRPRILSAAPGVGEPQVLSIRRWGLWHVVPGSGIEQRVFQQGVELVAERITSATLSEQQADRCAARVEQVAQELGRARGIEVRVTWE